MRVRRGVVIASLVLSSLFPGSVVCQEKPVWEIGVGFAALLLPDYRGSNEYRLYPLPYPYFIYRGDVLKVDEHNISGRIF